LAQARRKGNNNRNSSNKQHNRSHQRKYTGGNQTNEQAKLGSIMVVLGKTIQPVDDLEMLNNFHAKNGASPNRCYIC